MMLIHVYLLSAVALGAAATPSATAQRFIAFKAQQAFQWSMPTQTTPVTAECGDGQTMVLRDIKGVAKSEGIQLSVVFCHNGDPTVAETQSVMREALEDLRTHGAQAIADTEQRAQIINLLQREHSSLQ